MTGIIANYIDAELGRYSIGEIDRLTLLHQQVAGRGLSDSVFYGSRTKIWLRNHGFRNGCRCGRVE